MRFPSSTKIRRMAAHPRSPNCFRSFSKDFGEDFTSHSIFPPTKKDLGGILVHMRKYKGPKNFACGTPHQLLYPKIKWINPTITLTVCGKIMTGVMSTANLLLFTHGVILPKWAGNDWKKSYLLKILLTVGMKSFLDVGLFFPQKFKNYFAKKIKIIWYVDKNEFWIFEKKNRLTLRNDFIPYIASVDKIFSK